MNQDFERRLRVIGEMIFKHGEDAYRKGIKVEDNPWKGTSHEFYIWRNGWITEANRVMKSKI
jgi:hypothetical protein